MAQVKSNAAEVAAGVVRLVQGLGYQGRGAVKATLAEDVRDGVAQVILERTVLDQRGSDGLPLAPLAPSTIERKRRLGFPETILVETGKMLAESQLRGEAEVSRESVGIVYGTTEENRLKAEWAHEGRRRKPRRRKRPFFALTEADDPVLDRIHEKGLDVQAEAGGAE